MIRQQIVKTDSTFTAVKLLEYFFEFHALVPDQKDWKSAKLKKKTVLHHRFLELLSLCRAYGIDSIGSFVDGDFIPASANKYTEYHERMAFIMNMNKLLLHSQQYENLNVSDLRDNWIFIHSIAQKARDYSFDLLAEIISPGHKTFSRKELVQDFGFPEVSYAEHADMGIPEQSSQSAQAGKKVTNFKLEAVPPAL